MEDLQIYIVDKGYLDLLDFTDFPLVLKKSIANISDITARESDFSYDFEIPNNANNNSILFGMEYVSYADKSILGKQEAVIVLNGAYKIPPFADKLSHHYPTTQLHHVRISAPL